MTASMPINFEWQSKVVGIYGVSGSGKTTLLEQLRSTMDHDHFAFYDGSERLNDLAPGGLHAFQQMTIEEKTHWREKTITKIALECRALHKTVVIAGHYLLWDEYDTPIKVWTSADQVYYTHILYLDTAATTISQWCQSDPSRARQPRTIDSIQQWQATEKQLLQHACHEHGILFFVTSPDRPLSQTVDILLDWHIHSVQLNSERVRTAVNEIIAPQTGLEKVVIVDADRTLAPQDSGTMFWNRIAELDGTSERRRTLKSLFGSAMGYSYTAFRQAMLFHEEVAARVDFDAVCSDIASRIGLHSEFEHLFHALRGDDTVAIVVVTCGLSKVWDMVLRKAKLSADIRVIGGGRLSDGYVITPTCKADIVSHVRTRLGVPIWAIGDSPLDIPMMINADRAIVVVGEEGVRSLTMDAALVEGMEHHGLQAEQALLPAGSPPRLDTVRLPVVDLADPIIPGDLGGSLRVMHSTQDASTQVLTTMTRDARIAGPALREAHRRLGWYLAICYLPEVIGVEEHPIPHVQGHMTCGHRLANESKTSIIALMRGGEPMAMGVNDAFPLMRFFHAREPTDIASEHLRNQECVILVDSVINSGSTVVRFVQRLRELRSGIRIIVVAGVVQDLAVRRDSTISMLRGYPSLRIVCLRLSENKYTGTGVTDTGNRLFNTTDIA